VSQSLDSSSLDGIRGKKKVTQWSIFKSELPWYLFLAPTMLAIAVLTFYPLANTAVLSLFMSRNGGFEFYVGLSNYEAILTDRKFWNALYNTLYMGFFTILINLPVSFIFACLINQALIGKNLFRVLYFLPNVTSVIAISLVFKVLFYPTEAGTVNYVLSFFQIGPLGWLNDPNSSKWVVIIMGLWHSIGYSIIIFLAGLQSISTELYEAAEVDGATGFQRWLYITTPLMRPIFVFMLVIGVIGAMERFGDVYALGGASGSPLRSLQTIVSYFYEQGLMAGQYGLGAAAAVVIFFLIISVTLINFHFTKSKEA